jgi:hypothetical protein
MRRPGIAAPSLLIIALLLLLGLVAAAPAVARQEASPAPGTPAAQPTPPQPQPTPAPAQPAETPAATPAAPVTAATDVVTLVLWYANPPDQDVIQLFPLDTAGGLVANPPQGVASVGTADFPAPEEGVPTIVVGDTTFETYPRPDGVIERWTWLDDFEGARPATLVMQLAGVSGAYQGYYGTASFISRDEAGAGGVLVLALRPPAPAVAGEAATPAADAEGATAEEGTVDASAGEAAVAADPEATIDPGTVILAAPDSEGETPLAVGDAPLVLGA